MTTPQEPDRFIARTSLTSDHNMSTVPSTSMSAPECPVSFFEALPRELRNIIYAELWKNTPVIKAWYKGIHMQLQFQPVQTDEDKNHRMHNLPIWLRTCKMVLHEGLEELRIKSTWTVGPYHAPYSPKYYRSSDIGSQDAGKLFDPTTTGKMTLWTNPLRLDARDATEATFRMEVDDVEYIRALAVRLEVASRVRILRLKARVDPCCNTCYKRHQAKGWHLDLADLARFPFQLESFEFEMVRMKRIVGAGIENWSFCHNFFAKEVERVGNLWVGGEGVLTVQTSPGNKDWYDTSLFTFSSTRR